MPATLRFDGAAEDTTGGPIGAGVVLTLEDGGTLTDAVAFAHEGTNNVAEYEALLAGLRTALEAGVDRLRVLGDSELVIRQMRGEYAVDSDHLAPLHDEARDLVGEFKAVTFEHVPREENARADALAEEGAERSAEQELRAWEDVKEELEGKAGGGQERLDSF